MFKSSLFIIPARKGSKGLPGKNTKMLGEKPLIQYSLDFARQFTSDENICITTNDVDVLNIVNKMGYKEKFIRNEVLCNDTATSADVIKNAIQFYNKSYKTVILLQPTSPFRNFKDFESGLEKIKNCDLVVGVKEAKSNPYFNLFEENEKGSLKISKGNGEFTRRQDIPKVFEINGSMYIFKYQIACSYTNFNEINSINFIEMDEKHSIDIDTILDWQKAEFYLNK